MLLAALQDDKPQVRSLAAFKLGGISAPSVIDALITLLHDKDPSVRESALKAIYQQKAKGAQEAVFEISQTDPNPKVRARAQ